MAPFITLRVNDTEHKIDVDPENFTAGELNGVERATGMPWAEWLIKLGDRRVSSLAWSALAWIAVRRAGEPVPFDEFEDNLKIMQLVESVAPEEVAETAERVRRTRKS